MMEEEAKDEVKEEMEEAKDEEEEGEAVQVAIVKETYEIQNWQSKVARFLAYIVDGGILCS